MIKQKVKNRWSLVLGALMIQLCLGAIYAWGAFTGVLQDPNGAFNYSAFQTSWIFSAGLLTFSLVMIMAGRWQDKYGPRAVATIGGILLGTGYIIAGFTGSSYPAMVIFIGIFGGAGIGMAYVCPIAACVKWFPDMKGLITGLAVAGFGGGAFIFVKMAGSWMHLLQTRGINGTFFIFGIIFLVTVVLGAQLMSNPPAGWVPEGWDANAAASADSLPVKDLTQGEIIKTSQFWMIWFTFVFNAGCGLMVIKCLKNFGVLEGGLTPAVAGSALGLLALFNGLGRVVWGTVSQKITAKKAVILMCLLQGMMMSFLLGMGSSTTTLAIAASWIGFNFGGNFALFPLLTLENFGSKNLGANYGAVYTAYGVGGVIGPVMAGIVWDSMGTFKTAFIAASIACLMAAVISFFLKPPETESIGILKTESY